MKFITLLSLIFAATSVHTSAFAADDYSEQLAQALVDLSEGLTRTKENCNSGVRDVKTTVISEGVYQHSFSLSRQFRGPADKDCVVVITQDYTPTYHDGPISYMMAVTHSQVK